MRGLRKRIGAMAGTAALVTAGAVLCTGIGAGARTSGSPEGPGGDHDVGTASSPVPTPLTKPLVILYGDSLAWEAEASFVAAFAGERGVQVLTRTWGGTAICDYLDWMRRDAATLAPGAVVLEFSGNALTPCMAEAAKHGIDGDAYWARYRADAQTAIDIFAPTGTQVFFAGAPMSRSQATTGDFHGGMVNAMYAEIARANTGVRYVDAGAAVLDGDRWTATLPCLPGEPCTGGVDGVGRAVNLVRAPDGGHFCPASEEAKQGVVAACPVWSSGAFRYAYAMAQPVLAALSAPTVRHCVHALSRHARHDVSPGPPSTRRIRARSVTPGVPRPTPGGSSTCSSSPPSTAAVPDTSVPSST